jgi:hypothetical protein
LSIIGKVRSTKHNRQFFKHNLRAPTHSSVAYARWSLIVPCYFFLLKNGISMATYVRGNFFQCRIFAMKSVQNLKSFWRSSQNYFVLALFCYINIVNLNTIIIHAVKLTPYLHSSISKTYWTSDIMKSIFISFEHVLYIY